jgi:hypothetical protein
MITHAYSRVAIYKRIYLGTFSCLWLWQWYFEYRPIPQSMSMWGAPPMGPFLRNNKRPNVSEQIDLKLFNSNSHSCVSRAHFLSTKSKSIKFMKSLVHIYTRHETFNTVWWKFLEILFYHLNLISVRAWRYSISIALDFFVHFYNKYRQTVWARPLKPSASSFVIY